jgi:putative transposase
MTGSLRVRLSPGDRIAIDGVPYRLQRVVPLGDGGLDDEEAYQFEDEFGRVLRLASDEFLKLYGRGALQGLDERGSCLLQVSGDVLSDAKMLKLRSRRFWLERYDRAPTSKSINRLTAFIELHRTFAPEGEIPSPQSLQRWIRERGRPGFRPDALLKDRESAPRRRLDPRVLKLLSHEAERFWSDIRCTYNEVWVRAVEAVRKFNAEHDLLSDEALAPPARSTVYNFLIRAMDYEHACRRFGKREAQRLFLALKKRDQAKRILDVVEIDHTKLDVVVVDEVDHEPIGRVTLTVMIDEKSRYPLGFHVGFTDPGLEAAFCCVRMAVRPKVEWAKRFPHVQDQWLAFGTPRCIRVDQGLEFSGPSFEEACSSLGIGIDRCPTRTPEWKPYVERVIGTINTMIVHKLPGSIPFKPNLLSKYEIDPAKGAVLYLEELREAIYRGLVSIYAQQIHRGIGKSPAKAWVEGAKIDRIEISQDLNAVDQACSVLAPQRTLDREGVQLWGLTYRSPEITDFLNANIPRQKRRRATLGSIAVRPRYHPEDISKIHIWDDVRAKWITLPCDTVEYAQGVSLHLHQRQQAWARLKGRSFLTEEEMCARKVEFSTWLEELAFNRSSDRRRKARLNHPIRQFEGGSDVQVDSRARPLRPEEAADAILLIDPTANRKLGSRVQRRRLLPAPKNQRATQSRGAKEPSGDFESGSPALPRPPVRVDIQEKIRRAKAERGL